VPGQRRDLVGDLVRRAHARHRSYCIVVLRTTPRPGAVPRRR
jgi:hypothetical protein